MISRVEPIWVRALLEQTCELVCRSILGEIIQLLMPFIITAFNNHVAVMHQHDMGGGVALDEDVLYKFNKTGPARSLGGERSFFCSLFTCQIIVEVWSMTDQGLLTLPIRRLPRRWWRGEEYWRGEETRGGWRGEANDARQPEPASAPLLSSPTSSPLLVLGVRLLMQEILDLGLLMRLMMGLLR